MQELANGQLLVTRQNGVALIELNRPEQFNALTGELMRALEATVRELSEDDATRAMVLTGRGKAFSAGVDLKALETSPDMMGVEGLGPKSSVLTAFRESQVPIIAAVNGFAVTGGFELALACDFIYAADTARFADTHARVGLLPGWGLSQKLPRLVGINRAREISFTGNYFTAEEGLSWGLVNQVVTSEDLVASAMEVATDIATCIPDALCSIRQVMNQGWEMTLGDGLVHEGEVAADHNPHADMSEMPARLAALQARSRKAAR